ncbi:MAG: hypothetical protein AB1295_00660 [Candidatus Micrarchaeota archaeon]
MVEEDRRPQMIKPREEMPEAKHVQQKTGIDLSRLVAAKREMKSTVTEQPQNASRVFSSAMDILLGTPGLKSRMKDSQLLMLHQVNSTLKEDIFKDCQVQYGYNQRQKIYSIQATLYGRPRIITVRVGESFTEVSLADRKDSKVLEVLRQEDGKGVAFSRMD